MSDVSTLAAQKQAATELFQAGQLVKARDAYFAILIDIDGNSETGSTDPATVEIKVACLNNLMALFLKTKKYKEVVELSFQVLRIDSKSVKALFRQSQALNELGSYHDALLSLQKLLTIEPHNSQAKELMYMVMDKLDPLADDDVVNIEDQTLPNVSIQANPSNKSTPPPHGKEYPISRMPVSAAAPIDPLEGEGKLERVPVSFGGGWNFMNPEWTPTGDQSKDTTENSWSASNSAKEDAPVTAPAPPIPKGDDLGDGDEDATAQLFRDEAERTRIKNQFFSEALKRSNICSEGSHQQKKNYSPSHLEVIGVDEIVSETVAALTLEEKSLVAKVESKKAKGSRKPSNKPKKGVLDRGSGIDSLKKKSVVSTKVKS